VIECVPADSVDVESCACPPLRATVPSAVVPSLNVTVPVGVPDPDDTVAVNMTDCPKFDGFKEETSEVEVAIRLCPQEENLNEPMRVFQSVD